MTTPPDNKVTYLRPEHAKSALQRERARIVEAAIDEMGYSGPLLFAMDRVANRCGLSSETIKQHFNERQTLIETVGRTVSQILVDACVEQMTTQKSGIDRLLGVIRCHFDESISPRRLVAVWVLFYGATSQGSNYDEVFSEADDRIFSMIRRCVGDIIQNPPDSPQVLDISNAIYGIMDRYWLEEPLLRGSRSLVEYYESSFESIKNVLARLLPAAFDSDANTASTAHNGLLDSLIDYDPDPQKFDPVVKNLVNFIDTNDAEEIDLRRFCDAFEIEEKNILEDGRTWNDLLVESVRYIATIVDHEDQQALLSAGPDPKAQLDAIISYEDKSYFTRNRALWWQHVPTYKGLAQSILALDDANDKFLLQLLAEPLQALSDRLDRAADIHAIAKAILAIKNESWLSVYPGMTEKDFESLKRRDVDNCQALLVTTLRHAYSDLPVVTKMSAVPDNHRERIYNAAALAVLEHGLWGFTHSDLSRHCGLDAYRIRALFASKRQIISESIGWFCDLHHETCEQVLADDNLNGPEKLAYVAACFFRDQTYKSEVMALWNWAWMESQSDGDLRKICDGVDDAVLEYLCRAIDAVDDSLDDDTRDTVASLLAGLAERFNMPFSTEDRNNEHRERFLRELLALLKLVFPGIYQDWEPGMLLGQHDNASADNSTSDNVLTLDMTVEQSKQRVAVLQRQHFPMLPTKLVFQSHQFNSIFRHLMHF